MPDDNEEAEPPEGSIERAGELPAAFGVAVPQWRQIDNGDGGHGASVPHRVDLSIAKSVIRSPASIESLRLRTV